MSPSHSKATSSKGVWVLRRLDQAVVGVLVLVGLGSTIVWWCIHGGMRGSLVDVEQAGPKSATFQVDINDADWPELAQLPGIGETTAKRVVESREKDGPFRDPSDLRRVPGIGSKKLETIRPYLRPLPGAGSGTAQTAIPVEVKAP